MASNRFASRRFIRPVDTATRVKIKVCGITTVENALQCADLGADWIGLNFVPASPRCVDAKTAADIVRALPETCVPVALFVDQPADEIIKLARNVGFRTVQLHGQEPPEALLALREFTLIRAYRIGSAETIARMSADLRRATLLGRAPDAVLIDAFVADQAGGTGQEIPAELLALLPTSLPRMILAGGLTPDNVGARVAKVRPWMVDVASGVESSPGVKDLTKVEAFIQNARGLSRGA